METRFTARRRAAIVLALSLSAFLINIDVTIVNVALPSLVRELGATTTKLQWVVDAYSLVFAALILAAGSLSDRSGRKGMLLAGLAVFATGSLAGALCQSPDSSSRRAGRHGNRRRRSSSRRRCRCIANVFTERGERAKAIGLWGATTGVGVATGPIVGGWLLERLLVGQRLPVHGPIAAVVAAWSPAPVPTSRDPDAAPIDWRGLVLSTAGMATLVLGIIQAPDWGWGSPAALAIVAAGVAILAVFIVVEQRTARPMLDVGLFRNPRFTAASGSVAIGFFTLAGFTFLITQYFQFVKAYSPLGTGVRLLPVAISVAVASVARHQAGGARRQQGGRRAPAGAVRRLACSGARQLRLDQLPGTSSRR